MQALQDSFPRVHLRAQGRLHAEVRQFATTSALHYAVLTCPAFLTLPYPTGSPRDFARPSRRSLSSPLSSSTSPEDSAWQNKISTQISTLSSTVDRILQALESHGIVVPPAPADPTTASTSATPAPVGSIEVGGGGGEVTEDVGVGVDVGDYSAWTGDEPTGYEGEG